MSKDGKENKRGKLIKRLLSLWLLAWILCVMGATVYGRVAWLGVSIVLFTIYLLSRRVPELLLNSFESKIWQPLAWGCIILAVLAWSMWLSLLSFIAQALGDVVAYELSWFFDESNGFVLQMYEQCH